MTHMQSLSGIYHMQSNCQSLSGIYHMQSNCQSLSGIYHMQSNCQSLSGIYHMQSNCQSLSGIYHMLSHIWYTIISYIYPISGIYNIPLSVRKVSSSSDGARTTMTWGVP